MKVLVACEESQRVCCAFRKRGHEAYSCDILDCSGGHPEWHIKDDCLKHLEGWDLIIAHPPCTYLSKAATRVMYPNGVLNQERYEKGLEAKEFFMKLLNANCPKICVENPVSFRVFNMPPYTQEIQPYMFGEPYSKRTRLWLKGLPLLRPTNIVEYKNTKSSPWYNKGGNDRQRNRSKTFVGIAEAMAEQWGGTVG